ncbi:hypothetical protein HN873_017661 [Arachis hypogaea]
MASICWKLYDISSKNSSDYREISNELLKLISKVFQEKFRKAKRGEDVHITEEITLTQGTLKEKTNTLGIEVSKVVGATITKKLGLPQYPMHYYPVVYPYQPYGGALPIPFYSV